MLVLDTTILIDALRGKEAAKRKIIELEELKEALFTTQINVLELYRGAYLSNKSEEGLEKIKNLLEAFSILSINDDVYEWFAALSYEMQARGESINDFDELIAAITMTNGAAIITRDEHFNRVPGLKVISY